MRSTAPRRFDIFYNHVFRDSIEAVEGRFVPGRHVDRWCQTLQAHRKTSRQSARLHLKSTTFYAKIAWRIFQMLYAEEAPAFWELLYMSYSGDLSAYHLKKVKRYIEINPWFKPLQSLTDAESILHYKTPERPGTSARREITVEPTGILTFKRGRHPDEVICDDILRDPQVKLDLTQIEKITKIFTEEVVSLPKEQTGELHVGGTPQDKEDLFFHLSQMASFYSDVCPAIVNEDKAEVLWPEMFPLPRLLEIRDKEIGKKAFLKEFMCRPVREVSGYFEDVELDSIIDPQLQPWVLGDPHPGAYLVGGMDLGKKTHPSHLVLFEEINGELVQRLSRWYDKTDYTQQVEDLKALDKLYALSSFCYDDTRQELESFREQKELPSAAMGVPMTAKEQFELAARFGRRVRRKTIRLLPDHRQRQQILCVDDNLDAPESHQGHGDSFWSVALACKAADTIVRPQLHVVDLGSRRQEDDE